MEVAFEGFYQIISTAFTRNSFLLNNQEAKIIAAKNINCHYFSSHLLNLHYKPDFVPKIIFINISTSFCKSWLEWLPSCWWWKIFSMTRSWPRWRARDKQLSPVRGQFHKRFRKVLSRKKVKRRILNSLFCEIDDTWLISVMNVWSIFEQPEQRLRQ